MTDDIKRDAFGTEIRVDDKVAFNSPRYRGLSIGRVKSMAAKMITIEWHDTQYRDPQATYKTWPQDVVVYIAPTTNASL